MRALGLLCAAVATALTLAGCSSRPVQAPVIERAPPTADGPAAARAAETRPDAYIVRRGDTLFSIALDQGLDYKELAAWNNLDSASLIRPGQELRLKSPAGVQEAAVTVSPVTSSGRVETRPLGVQGPVRTEPAARPSGAEESIKSEPLARKLPYSAENLALLQRGEAQAKPPSGPAALAPAPPPAPAPAPAPGLAPTPRQEPAGKTDSDIGDEEKIDWGWPAQGKILAGFSEPSNKGLDIAGKPGEPVIAAAQGRVIFSGEMRGYGKLIVIKHNGPFSSVYAHNRDILVKEKQNVIKGQKIAEIGKTDTDAPKLHFEIRKFGKPVDPAKYLLPP